MSRIFAKFEKLRQGPQPGAEGVPWDPADSHFIYVAADDISAFEPLLTDPSHTVLHIHGEADALMVQESLEKVAALIEAQVRDKPPGKGATSY